MIEIDIVIVATRRFELLKQTIESFSKLVFVNFKISNVFINIDPIWGDEADLQSIKDLIRDEFGNIKIFEPKIEKFTNAVKLLWLQTKSDVVLHLEDDWVALEPITSEQVKNSLTNPVTSLTLMHADKNWNGKQLYHYRRYRPFKFFFKIEDKSRPHFSTSPSFWDGNFLRECAKLMDTKFDPEKQFYDNLNLPLQNFVSAKKCKFLVGHPNLVMDTGRKWREERNIEKIIDKGVSIWKYQDVQK